jgi:meso-butanediol dehydrogenase/(S,S)-butanediol dehydrogenase/diacetyl reductase
MASKSTLKTVVITGAASGIGLDTAKLLLETGGYRVLLVGRDGDKLNTAAKELGGPTDSVATFECDLADAKQIRKTVEKITATHKSIYGLVNNAGVYPFGGLAATTEAIWDDAMDVNLKGPFLLTQALVPYLAKSQDGARIVNVSSTAGLLPNHFALAYSISKAALIHMTRTLAKELGKDGITVNCVCPGIVRTPMHEAYHANTSELEHFYAKRGAAFPMGRVGEPRDISGAIRFFLSPEAGWVTGDVCVVDGGRLLL